ncbi:N-6 DNA Methylase [Georgenia satyanarayanai]|uniref:site-specific DNA-methyltransferase (adenine-specific) n=1 Tax=Georgenia satyanarayanai TaxID=860221 RepID=A0A2Y9AI78_9MICO|nr:type ISP restriction/modification enzyme [Georgenia satyanarayanai]PYF99068.1 N-6 DNA methylase [Georgenia satyanarayanai]SSA44030.1 N-6 DNA Methylase [Georgenia satyanarayanai]
MTQTAQWLAKAVSTFGDTCKAKLSGPGDREAAIRAPLEALLGAAGDRLGVDAVFHDEVRDTERQVRPDYGVSVKGAITGYVEVKAPGRHIDPARFTGHDKRQWERQRDLPNLLYTNGTDWRLYRDGDLHAGPVTFGSGSLALAGAGLTAPPEFESLITDFLRWKPAPITSVGALVRAVAPLTRLLRGEVLDQLQSEDSAIRAGADKWSQPFTGLANDWRALLFPTADDDTFADGYAQAVTFALLLARTEGIDVTGQPLHEIGAALGDDHSLMGRALQLLTDDVAADFRVTLDLLVRVIGAVDWARVRRGRRDTYLHLYENFLEQYDNDLRKQSGSYYTPREIVDEMVRLTEEALVARLGRERAFRDPDVLTVDPAMGTGTYLHTILERVAEHTEAVDGPGAVAGVVRQVAERLVGFELQMGPYAVAELRATDLLASHGASAPASGMRFYVTDTLDDPAAAETQIGSGLRLIAESRRRANEVKRRANVTVVIGNPPYRERAEGMGGWVEKGSEAHGKNARGILEDWRDPDTARHFHNLKNSYVYFWRWASWKVWESTPHDADDGDAGVICFISTSGYVGGPGFTAMREYLRREASEGWVIDLTPEGQTPDVPTRIFPGVRQPLAIGLFIRKADAMGDVPATIHYRAVHGRQAEKFAELSRISLDDDGWRLARTDWTAPLTPSADTAWDTYPALNDLLPWTSPGVTGNRRWPYGPSSRVLERRWRMLQAEADPRARAELFKETGDRSLTSRPQPLPLVVDAPSDSLAQDRGASMNPVRVGYRSFDRQWLIPDARVLDRARPDLWAARVRGQVFTIEQHSKVIEDGPGLVFSTLIPDMDHFNNRGGRTLPLLYPDGSPNLAPGVIRALSKELGRQVTASDVLAYVAGVVAHPGFTRTFADELTTPGIRVPLTADAQLFADAVALGEQVVWLHTYGEMYAGSDRPRGDVRYPPGDERQPKALTPITTMPTGATYDANRAVVVLGDGEFGPVREEVWDYAVGGKNVIKSWVNYRKAEPGGKKSSPLDHVHVDEWDPDWTTELIDLFTVLTRLVELEPEQAELLERVLAGPLLTMEELRLDGVRWPASAADRKPRHGFEARTDDTVPAFDL